MVKQFLLVALLLGSISGLGQDFSHLPLGYGWQSLGSTTNPSTRSAQCPSTYAGGNEGCPAGTFSYSGGIVDLQRNRLLIWGGGHQDYCGNELYEVNLANTPQWTRLTNPTPFAQNPYCSPTFLSPVPEVPFAFDGRPVSRHTYGNIVYVPAIQETGNIDRLYQVGGSQGGVGAGGDLMWRLDLPSVPSGGVSTAPVWYTDVTKRTPYAASGHAIGLAYDPRTHLIFGTDILNSRLFTHKLDTNTYPLSVGMANASMGANSAIDPIRRLLLTTGNGNAPTPFLNLIDISSVTTSGGSVGSPVAVTDASCSIPRTAQYSSVVYDPVWGVFVLYPGTGNSIYLLNPDATATVQAGTYSLAPRTCQSVSGGAITPPDSAASNGGAYGRFGYLPDPDVFVYLPYYTASTYIFRLDRTVPDTAKVFSTSGSTQSSVPVSIPRVFVKGEIANYPQPVIAGQSVTQWQVDVKNRWPDNSVKYAIVSLVVPTLSTSGVSISFQNQANRCYVCTGNTPAGYLDTNAMLSGTYNFDATIVATGSVTATVHARDLLTANKYTYWLQGPVVTAIILEDKLRGYDFNTDGLVGSVPLHPQFEAWFYPGTSGTAAHVEVGYGVENAWASGIAANSARDQTYAISACLGAGCTPAAIQSSFKHLGWTRWHKSGWIGTPPNIHIDHNAAYFLSTGATWNYNRRADYSAALTSVYSSWNGYTTRKSIPGDASGVGDLNWGLNAVGAQYWIGPLPSADLLYLLTSDDRMRTQMLGNADLVGRLPKFFREADALSFDGTNAGQGRLVSINARPRVSFNERDQDPNRLLGNCGSGNVNPVNLVGSQANWFTSTITLGAWRDDSQDETHAPEMSFIPYLFTGKWYYLDQLLTMSNASMAVLRGCDDNISRQGALGLLAAYGSEPRGMGWGMRGLAMSAFIAPDGWPEKTYFDDKLKNNIVAMEGALGLPASYTGGTKDTAYNWGKNTYTWSIASNPSPLGAFVAGNADQAGCAANEMPNTSVCASPWMEGFLITSLGLARQYGYATDNVMGYMGKRPVNVVLNSQSNPYLLQKYDYPQKDSTTGTWLQTWADFKNHYSPQPTTYPTPTDADGSYTLIFGATLGVLAPFTINGYSGQAAYDWYRSNNTVNEWMFTDLTPKWDVIPSVNVSSVAPPLTPYTLSTSVSPAGGGTVSCDGSFPTYASQTQVHCTQTPNAGYTFSNWSGGCTGTLPCTVTMVADTSITANYSLTAVNLSSIAVSPSSATITAGQTQQFAATCTWSDATQTPCTNTANWTSSSSAAIIGNAPAGLASGVSAGSATITATQSGQSGTASLTVNPAVVPQGTIWQGSITIQGSGSIK